MHVAVTGASGFIGRALTRSLLADGHRVLPIGRNPDGDGIVWDPMAGIIDAAALDGIDAVVHLAGEPIAARPWTRAQRARLVQSRIRGTDLLARTLADMQRPPTVLVSGSAQGFYGSRGSEWLPEPAEGGTDFLAELCRRWESSTAPASDAGIRVVYARTGIVLDPAGGMLGRLLPIFRLGLGGRAGRGDQWLSWITLADEVRAIRFAIERDDLAGPVNLNTPNPVTNGELTRSLGRALRRPTLLPVPLAVRHLPFGVGDLAEALLFTSARLRPDALIGAGFEFEDPDLDEAISAMVSGR